MISVVVPVRGEASPGPDFVAPLREAGAGEVVVAADPAMTDATWEVWRAAGANVLVSDAPRGTRLNEAAAASSGEILLFLHADTLLPEGWAEATRRAIDGGAAGGAFRLSFSGSSPSLAFVASVANRRTALTRVPYGDQAPFVRRDLFEKLGGFAPWPLLEEVDFGRRLKREGPIAFLQTPVKTSPRRYLDRGVVPPVLKNWSILLRWRLGASPFVLAEEYRGHPADGSKRDRTGKS